MRKKLGETGFLAVAIWAAAMSSTAWSCAVDEEFENNGSSPIYAVPLASEPGSSLKLHLSSGGDCFVGMDVALPRRVALLLDAAESGQDGGAWNVRLLRRVKGDDKGDSVTLETRTLTTGEPSQPFDLVSGDYYFALRPSGTAALSRPSAPGMDRQRALAATHRLVVAASEPVPLPLLEPRAGAAQTIRLDRYSGSAVFNFDLRERVELDLELDISQWPLKQRESLQVSLQDEQGHAYEAEFARTASAGVRTYRY